MNVLFVITFSIRISLELPQYHKWSRAIDFQIAWAEPEVGGRGSGPPGKFDIKRLEPDTLFTSLPIVALLKLAIMT